MWLPNVDLNIDSLVVVGELKYQMMMIANENLNGPFQELALMKIF